MTTAIQESMVASCYRVIGLLGIIVFIFSFALTPSAQAQCPDDSIEAVIELAGAGEKLAYDIIDEVSGLPLPPPRLGQFQQIANQFADVSMGILRVRTQVFRGNFDAAEAQFNALGRQTTQLQRAISKVSTLPIPLPDPDLEKIAEDLTNLVYSLPLPPPEPE